MKSFKYLRSRFLKDTLFRNSLFLMSSTATMAAFGFLFWTIVARKYTAEQVGIAATLISAMGFISYLSLLGFNSTFVRFLPKSKLRNEQIDTGIILVASVSFVVSLVYAIIAPRFVPGLAILHEHWYTIFLFAFLVTGSAVNLLTDSIFIAYRTAQYNLFVDGFLGGLSQVSLPILLIGLGALGIFASVGIALTIAMLFSLFLLVRKFSYSLKFKIRVRTLREVISYSVGNYTANVLNILPTLVLPIILLNKLGGAAAAYYYLAFMMANVLFTIAYAVSQSLFAEGSYGEVELRILIKRSVIILSIIIIPASILLALLGPIILQIFGKGYSDNAGGLIAIFALSGIFVSSFVLQGVLLRIKKLLGVLIKANIIYSVSIIGLALLWVDKGLIWVGIAWLLGHAITSLYMFLNLLRSRRLSE